MQLVVMENVQGVFCLQSGIPAAAAAAGNEAPQGFRAIMIAPEHGDALGLDARCGTPQALGVEIGLVIHFPGSTADFFLGFLGNAHFVAPSVQHKGNSAAGYAQLLCDFAQLDAFFLLRHGFPSFGPLLTFSIPQTCAFFNRKNRAEGSNMIFSPNHS